MQRWLRATTTLVVCAMAALATTQTYSIPFNYNHLNDSGRKVLVDKDGSIYVAGTGIAADSGDDFVLIKYTQNSSNELVEQWHHHYNGPSDGDDTVSGMVLDSSGNVYVCGTSRTAHNPDNFDMAVWAVKPDGTNKWGGDGSVRYDSGSNATDTANAMCIDKLGNLIVGGWTTYSGGGDALVAVFRPDGTLKWAKSFDNSGKKDVINAVATNGSDIFATGYSKPDIGTQDLLYLRYLTGSAIADALTVDYDSNDDEGLAVTSSEYGRAMVAGYVKTSGGASRFAVYAFDPGVIAPAWSDVYTSLQGAAADIRYYDGHAYATGLAFPTAASQFMTVKLNWDGTYSNTWISNGWGTGVRLLAPADGQAAALALWPAGTNVYVTGTCNLSGQNGPMFSQYTSYYTTRYTKDGDVPGPMWANAWPLVPPNNDTGRGVADYCAGQVLVTGDYVNVGNGDTYPYDMGQLLYAPTEDTWLPGSYNIDVGTYSSGSLSSLDSSDDNYLVVTANVQATPSVQVTVNKTISNTQSEMCLEVEQHVNSSNINLQVEVFNDTTGE